MPLRPLVLALFAALALGQAGAKTLLVLPMAGDRDKLPDIRTLGKLFFESLSSAYGGAVVAAPDSAPPCDDKGCAAKAATEAKADEAVYASINRLGNKWILSASIVGADGSHPFSQRATAANVEDLEPVLSRMASALATRSSLEKVATVDNITEKEEEKGPTRRRSMYSSGFALGYLYPIRNSFSYLENTYSYPVDTMRTRRYSQMIKVDWLNSWEFNDNLALDFDAVWAVPTAIGGDIDLKYLTSRSDFSPFFGGGLGLFYVKGDDGDDTKRNSGPALNAQAGIMLFRTYDIHVQARAQYHVILNSDFDHGPSFDVGIVYQRRESKEKESGWMTFWKYYLIGAVVISVVGAAAH